MKWRRRVCFFLASLVLASVPADALIERYWVHPCPCDNRDSNPKWSSTGTCTANWDALSHWQGGQSDRVPDTTSENASIFLTNTGCCGDYGQCSVDGDCNSGTCTDFEAGLVLKVPNVAIRDLTLLTHTSTATSEHLTVWFTRAGMTGTTMTTTALILDAANGPITVSLNAPGGSEEN